MAEIAARGREGFRQLRGLDLARRLEEKRRQHQALQESRDSSAASAARGERLKAARRAVDGEHGTFAEKGVDAHGVIEK